MTLTSSEDLSVAELCVYVPALLLSLLVCFRQGFAKDIGWFYLLIVSVLRLIGASVTLYIQTQNDYSSGLLETAAITSAIGISPLLLCLMGILQRLHGNMSGHGYSQNIFRPIHLLGLVGLVVGIIGGVDSANPTSDHYDIGRDCTRAAAIIFLAIYLALAVITILTATHKREFIDPSEKKLIAASLAVLPFILVRLVYSIASAFSSAGSVFYFLSPDILVQALMMFAIEAIAVAIYIWAGLFTPTLMRPALDNSHNVEASGSKGIVEGKPQSQRLDLTHERQVRRTHQQRSIGDYRPSRLIRDAIRDWR